MSGRLELYPDTPLPAGTWWKNAAAVKEYNTIKKTLKVARQTKNIDTVAAILKQRQHKLTTKKNVFDTSTLIAFALGMIMMLGVGCVYNGCRLVDFGLFLILVSFFHMWEYHYVSLFHPETLSYESFLLTHSRAFQLAMSLAFAEYFIEWYFLPSLKGHLWLYGPAFLVAAAGQAIRVVAMYSAGVSFHHIVQEEKAENHTLVTTGIYSIWRHPSYFGWFWWSLATQVVLGNPVGLIAYSIASWHFFADRIPYEILTQFVCSALLFGFEEDLLVEMFGQAYKDYCKKVPIRIPFMPSKL